MDVIEEEKKSPVQFSIKSKSFQHLSKWNTYFPPTTQI